MPEQSGVMRVYEASAAPWLTLWLFALGTRLRATHHARAKGHQLCVDQMFCE